MNNWRFTDDFLPKQAIIIISEPATSVSVKRMNDLNIHPEFMPEITDSQLTFFQKSDIFWISAFLSHIQAQYVMKNTTIGDVSEL